MTKMSHFDRHKTRMGSLRPYARDPGLLFSLGNVLLVIGNPISFAIMSCASVVIAAVKFRNGIKKHSNNSLTEAILHSQANSQTLNATGLVISGGIGAAVATSPTACLSFIAAIAYGLGHYAMSFGKYWRESCALQYPFAKSSDVDSAALVTRTRSIIEKVGQFFYRNYSRITPGLFATGYLCIAAISNQISFQALSIISAIAGYAGAITNKDAWAYRMFALCSLATAGAHGVIAVRAAANHDWEQVTSSTICVSFSMLFAAGEKLLAEMCAPKIIPIPRNNYPINVGVTFDCEGLNIGRTASYSSMRMGVLPAYTPIANTLVNSR